MDRVGVIDYGAGNTESVLRALRAIGSEPEVIGRDDARRCREMSHLVFPGVGRASQARQQIAECGLEEELRRHVAAGKWLLGICVGMQLLGKRSEEDDTEGLSLLDFKLSHFRNLGVEGPVPHMGWNALEVKSEHPSARFFSNQSEEKASVYFVHSYGADLQNCLGSDVIATTTLERVSFASVVGRDNVIGTQFHVEKSGKVGLQFLRHFLEERSPC